MIFFEFYRDPIDDFGDLLVFVDPERFYASVKFALFH
jgi:hypothetical protein